MDTFEVQNDEDRRSVLLSILEKGDNNMFI